jgi:hypothetical protein
MVAVRDSAPLGGQLVRGETLGAAMVAPRVAHATKMAGDGSTNVVAR